MFGDASYIIFNQININYHFIFFATVARHFGRNKHTRDDLKVQILELIRLDPLGPHTDAYHDTMEHFWIHRLRTLQHLGLNANDEKKYKRKQGNPVTTGYDSNHV